MSRRSTGWAISSKKAPMLNSLRFRLLLTFTIVVTVAVGTVAFFASRSTSSEFRRSVEVILDYPNYSLETKILAINKFLDQHAGERQVWEGLQTLLERMGRTSQARFVMADLEGTVTADSTGELIGGKIDTSRSKPFAVFLIEKDPILAYAVPLQDRSLEAISARFTSSVNRSLLIAIGAGGLAALLLTLLLSQSILNPIEGLIFAARRMEKGDFSHRGSVPHKGGL